MHKRHVLLPVIGLLMAIGVPLARYAMKDRHELAAIDIVSRVHTAQYALHRRVGAYATDLATLQAPCGGPPMLGEDLAGAAHGIGYEVRLRPADGAEMRGSDCHGRPLAGDYVVTAAPASAWNVGRQAFAMRGDGRIYLFYDGIPPHERDIVDGLPTPVEARDVFTIP